MSREAQNANVLIGMGFNPDGSSTVTAAASVGYEAQPVVPITPENLGERYALLKTYFKEAQSKSPNSKATVISPGAAIYLRNMYGEDAVQKAVQDVLFQIG